MIPQQQGRVPKADTSDLWLVHAGKAIDRLELSPTDYFSNLYAALPFLRSALSVDLKPRVVVASFVGVKDAESDVGDTVGARRNKRICCLRRALAMRVRMHDLKRTIDTSFGPEEANMASRYSMTIQTNPQCSGACGSCCK